MKRLLLILILTLSFQSLVKAEDISDFEIEGMSINKSVLDYISVNEVLDNTLPYFETKREYYITGIVSNLKRQNTQDPNADPSDGETVKKVKADVDSTKLRSFINNLGSDE